MTHRQSSFHISDFLAHLSSAQRSPVGQRQHTNTSEAQLWSLQENFLSTNITELEREMDRVVLGSRHGKSVPVSGRYLSGSEEADGCEVLHALPALVGDHLKEVDLLLKDL